MTRLLTFVAFVLFLVALSWANRPAPTAAVCTTDSDCAAWEVRHNIPESERCYGAPCPAEGSAR